MTRIANYATTTSIIEQILKTQSRLNDLQVQASTEKVSQDYKGLAPQSQRLVNLENSRDTLSNFVANNETADLRLQTTNSVLDGVKQTIRDFRETLLQYDSSSLTDQETVKNVQDAAFRALQSISVYLNTDVDGRFLFSGARMTTQPVDMGLTSLSDFQAQYDGSAALYPPTRDAHVGTNVTLSPADTGGLTMSGTNTLTAGTAGSLAGIPVGASLTLASSGNGNDGTYTVVSNDGTNITISGALTIGATTLNVTNTVNNGADATAVLSVSSYYNGDTATLTQRVDQNRDFSIDLNAIDPAFEKAIRAMGIIAQGTFGTAGGLDAHPERVDQAIYLISSSLESAITGTPPFGTETTGNINQVQQDLGYQRVLIDQSNQQHNNLIGFFDQRVTETENVNTTEVVAKLLDQSRALELAYQAIARIQQLSLGNYLT